MTNPNDSIHNSEQGPQDSLTKREYFAAIAMQGICAAYQGNREMSFTTVAERSVKLADALIKALNNK